MVEEPNIPLSIMDKTMKQKKNKDIEHLNNSINQLYLTDVYGTLYPINFLLKCTWNIM